MDKMSRPDPCEKSLAAFSLVELLVVIAILAVLAAVAFPAVSSILAGSTINRAGITATDSILRARQEAVTRSREVQVLFYNFSTPASAQGWRGFQVFRVEQSATGRTIVPSSRITLLPEGAVISSNAALSPLLFADANLQGTTNLPAYGSASYAGFRFRPNGSVSSEINLTNNFLTLQGGSSSGNPPPNYYTLQINPVTGKITAYRP
jgi:uncharacterized protein (TIGR02596 family)